MDLKGVTGGITNVSVKPNSVDDDFGSRINPATQTGTVTVTAPFFETSSLSVSPTAGTLPLEVNASATVTNDGAESGSTSVAFVINGSTVATQSVTLAAGASTTVEFSHTFTTEGLHNVTIDGLTPVTVAVNAPPVAALSVNRSTVNESEPIEFNASGSTDDGSITEYRWDFDGDGTVDMNTSGATVTHAYPDPGTFDATVTVVDDKGVTDDASVNVTVLDITPPVPSFTINRSEPVNVGVPVGADASASSDNVGITTYAWKVSGPENQTLSGPTPTFAFTAPGTYTLMLVVSDAAGNQNSTSQSVDVTDQTDPTARLSTRRPAIVNVTWKFDASASTDNDEIEFYRWDLDGDGSFEQNTTDPMASHVYTQPNRTLTVTLEVTDPSGRTDTTSLTLNTSRAPAVEVTDPAEGEVVNTSSVTVEYRLDNLGAGGNPDHVEYNIDRTGWQDTGNGLASPANVTLSGLSDGRHAVAFRIVNASGDMLPFPSAFGGVNFTVDTVAPVIDDVNLAPGDIVTADTILISNYTDATSGVNASAVAVRVNGSSTGQESASSSQVSLDLSSINLPDGDHDFTVVVTDHAGHSALQTVTVTLDTTAPTIDNASATDRTNGDGTVSDGHRVLISADVADPGAGVNTVTANASAFGAGVVTLTDGDGDGNYTATVTVDVTRAAADGTYAITVRANDTLGNERTAQTNTLDLLRIPDITVAPTSHDFGDVVVGANGTTNVTITNDGHAALTISGTSIEGANASVFTIVSGGGSATLNPGESRDVRVEFAPASTGDRTARLRIDNDDPNEATVNVSLAGRGVKANFTLTPTVQDYGALRFGTTDTATFTLSNVGESTGTVNRTLLTGSSAFTLVSLPPTTLAPGESATFSVEFNATPPAGVRNAKLVIEPQNPNVDPANATLTGRVNVSDISPSARAIAYHSVAVGDTVSQRFAIVNDGNATLNIADVRLAGPDAGDFAITQGAGSATLGQAEGVDVVVEFTPSSLGAKTARVVVESDDPNKPVVNITLSGTGRTAQINATPRQLGFGQVSTSGQLVRNVTVTNDGFATLDVTGASISGPDDSAFTIIAGGTESIVPGETHVIQVAFAPGSPGSATATLSITSNDPNNGTETVRLDGVGTTPEITVTPTAQSFGDVPNSSSTSRIVNVTNEGNATLVMRAPSVTGTDAGSFEVIDPGGTTFIAPGETQPVSVAFAPTAPGDLSATLTIPSNDLDEPSVSVALDGTSTVANISSSPSAIAFGDVRVGSSATATVTITNSGTDDLNITDLSLVGASPNAFAITQGDIGATVNLPPGQNHTFTVAFQPAATGSRSAAVNITSDDPTTPNVSIAMGGRGVRPDIDVTPTTIDYPDTRVAGEVTREVTVRNVGNANLSVNATRVDSPAWVTRSRAFVLRPGEERNVTATFAPSSGGNQSANLTIPSDDFDEPTVNVTMSARAIAPDVTVTPRALKFGNVTVGATRTLNVTVSNGPNATASLPVENVVVIGPDSRAFSVDRPGRLNFTLQPNQQQNLTVNFTPLTPGDNKTATLRILTSDPSVRQVDVWLTNTETIVQVRQTRAPEPGEQGVNVSVQNATANLSVSANVSDPESRGSNVGVDQVNLTSQVAADFTLNLTTSDDPQTANFTRSNVSQALKFINVSKTIDDRNLTNVSFVFRVSKVALDRVNRSPADITLYRFNETTGIWNELNVTLVGETRTHFLYLAETPGFSEFGAGAKKPDFRIEEAQLSVSAIRVGETVRIVTRITNSEDAADGTFNVKLLLDGSVVDSRQVTIAAGGTRQVTFERSFSSAGNFTVEVNQTLAGTVSVQAAQQQQEEEEEPAQQPATSTPAAGGAAPPPSASFSLEEVSASTTQIETGESVEVRATVTNTGDAAGEFMATFRVNGVPINTQTVELAAGESAEVIFSRTFREAGTFELEISGASAGTLTVERAATPTPSTPAERPTTPVAAFAVADVAVDTTTVEVGETVEVTATIENRGNASGEFTATFSINGVVVDREVVEAAPGETVAVTFERTFEEAGTFELAVGGESAGTVEVEPTPTPPPTTTAPPTVVTSPPPTEQPGIFTRLPGFGPGVALLALLVFGLLAARRRSEH